MSAENIVDVLSAQGDATYSKRDESQTATLIAFNDRMRDLGDLPSAVTEVLRLEAALRENEARFSFLDRLAAETAPLSDADTILVTTTRLLGEHLAVSVCAYADMDDDQNGFTIRGDWAAPGSMNIVGHYSLSDFGTLAVENLGAGLPLIVNDNLLELAPDEAATFQNIGIAATICMPLVKNGRLTALMAIHDREPRVWTDSELSMLREVTARSWAHVERVGSLAELRATEERLRLAVDNAEIGFWDVDIVRDILIWPPRTKAMFGISPDAPVSMKDFYFGLHPDDREATSAAYAAAADPVRRALYDVEYRTIGKEDGVLRWVAAKGRGVFDLNGHCLRVAGTAINVTARRTADERLRVMNADLEKLVIQRTQARGVTWQVSPDLMGALNAAGYFETSNPAWRTMLGWSEEEVASMSIWEMLHPDDVEPTRQGFALTQIGQPAVQFPNRYRCKDGSYRWISWVGVPEDGIVYCTGRDITEERQKEADLAARTAELDQLWSLSEDLLARANYGGMLSAVSPAWQRVLGWSEAELLARPYATFMHPDDMDPTLAGLARMGETGQPTRFENRIATTKGDWKSIEWTVAPEADGSNFIAVGRDRSDVKKREAELEAAQEQLRQSQKMEAMGSLTGGVAHDFNNLLTPIVGALDLLQRRGVGGEREQRLIAGAAQSADRARTLVQRLLAFARRQPLQATAVDVAKLVTGMVDLISSTTGPQIRVSVEASADLPAARADANQLEMALLNLSVNARDAMPAGGTLRITATPETRTGHEAGLKAGEYIRLSVADSGVGMDEATLARAVEPFFSTKGVGKGTGLGLSMVHGLASQLGGALKITSRPEFGTNIELWLPQSNEPTDAPEATGNDTPPSEMLGTVLLVDDEDLVRISTADMLMDLGYTVVEAGSAEEALRIVEKGLKPDLLVTDHLMPGMSGTDLARTLQGRWAGFPVIVVSGYAESEGIAPDLPRLTKPFRNYELASSLAALVEAD